MSLSDRKRRVLKAVIDSYIENAEPVGSKIIAAKSKMEISSATIRNEMSELEELGYLEQPHISAGRVPSTAGYRLYVNELMNRYRLSVSETEAINAALRSQIREFERTIRDLGSLVSELTNYTAYTIMPSVSSETILKFDILLVEPQAAVLVLVTSGALVKNKHLKLSAPTTEDKIAALTALLNNHFTRRTLDNIPLSLVKRASDEAGELDGLFAAAMDFVSEVLDGSGSGDLYLGGISRILSHPEYRDPEKAQQILDYLTDKKEVARRARAHMQEKGNQPVKIFIGSENETESLRDASVVYGTYDMGEHMRGLIGIVGPRRMDYAKVAANLNYFLTGFNKLLRDSFFGEL